MFLKKIFENSPLRIASFYLVFSLVYIYYSDRLLLKFSLTSETLTQIQTYKGFAFVIVSALLIFFLSSYEMNRKKKLEKQIKDQQAEYNANLLKSYNELEKRVEERTLELRKKNNELKIFTSSVSHDLRTPLRSITSFSQLLIRNHSENLDKDGKEFLNYIIHSAQQMNKLIEDLVKYAKLDFYKAEFEKISLNELLEDIIKTFDENIKASSAEINITKNIPIIVADNTLVTQIFSNLISNALHYSRENINPTININYETDNRENITIFIEDNGIGIKTQYSEKIFELFQRLHGNDEYEGTGIGLAIVKKNAEMLNGTAWLESSTPGVGSTFCVQLPLK